MKINSLKLVDFRNYHKLNITFNDKLNIIYGNNGSGKTNLVEAIYALSLTKSFRTNNDRNLIKKGELSTKIEGEVESKSKTNYQVIISKEGKKVKIDNDVKSKISDYISNINIILLEPDEQILFSDSPGERRKLLNIELCGLKKEYLIYLNNYNKVLKQRNFYLRELLINGNSSRDYLNILTKKLISYGYKIYEYRLNFINKINEYINNYYNDIFASGELKIKYVSDYNNKTEEEIFDRYLKIYNKEINIGKTLEGIHHDDLIFLLDDENIAIHGSNGQRKNAILSFKLSEIKVFNEEKNDLPILILDDIFSALDNLKIKNIIKLLNNNEVQTFITTTEIKKIDKKLLENAKIFRIEDGIIEEA
jgi:DNA replication and repair protein RecF